MDIYIKDLKEEVQKEVLEFLHLSTPGDGNYDVFPLFVLDDMEKEDK